jgi:hypothetical protein
LIVWQLFEECKEEKECLLKAESLVHDQRELAKQRVFASAVSMIMDDGLAPFPDKKR